MWDQNSGNYVQAPAVLADFRTNSAWETGRRLHTERNPPRTKGCFCKLGVLFVGVFIYVYVYTYVYIYTYIYMYIYIYIYLFLVYAYTNIQGFQASFG